MILEISAQQFPGELDVRGTENTLKMTAAGNDGAVITADGGKPPKLDLQTKAININTEAEKTQLKVNVHVNTLELLVYGINDWDENLWD